MRLCAYDLEFAFFHSLISSIIGMMPWRNIDMAMYSASVVDSATCVGGLKDWTFSIEENPTISRCSHARITCSKDLIPILWKIGFNIMFESLGMVWLEAYVQMMCPHQALCEKYDCLIFLPRVCWVLGYLVCHNVSELSVTVAKEKPIIHINNKSDTVIIESAFIYFGLLDAKW